MNESYKELLLKREKGVKEALIRAACVALTVVAGLLTLMTGKITFFIIVVVLGVLDYFVFQWTDIEFEYLYLDKELVVDKVMAKSRRKRVATYTLERMEILAPVKS